MKIIVSVEIPGADPKSFVVAQLDRSDPLQAATFGLTLQESKALLGELQRRLTQAQLSAHFELARVCRHCGARRWLKDRRTVCFKSLFGGVELAVPRIRCCQCAGESPGVETATIDGLVNWVSPELEYIQSRLAADMSYDRAANVISMLLGADAGNTVSTLRRRTLSVGERLESELRQEPMEVVLATSEQQESLLAMGLDSGYIRDCHPRPERNFEVVVGRLLRPDGGSRSLGFVRRIETNDEARRRLKHRVAQEGTTTDRVMVFSDGDASLRTLQLDVLPNARHVLDWYHLTRHLTVLRQVLDGQEAIERLRHNHCHLDKALTSLKWRLWHGQHYRAVRKLEDFLFTLHLPTITYKAVTKRLKRLARKLLVYIKNNADSLVDYGERYRAGTHICTSFVESAVNQLIDKRMSKSQQMRWSYTGAHLLLQVRAEVVDGRLGAAFKRWYPDFNEPSCEALVA